MLDRGKYRFNVFHLINAITPVDVENKAQNFINKLQQRPMKTFAGTNIEKSCVIK